jgi:hypothetical protein
MPEPEVAEVAAMAEEMPEPEVAEVAAMAEEMPEPEVAEVAAMAEEMPEPEVAEVAAMAEEMPEPEAAADVPAAGHGPSAETTPPEAEPAAEGEWARTPGLDSPRIRPRRAVRRPSWPEPEKALRSDGRPLHERRWLVVGVVVALFAAGWFLGQVDFARRAREMGSALQAIGLGPARYEVSVASRPSGAWIAVDGVDQPRRTPATLELKPGTHEVVLSFSGVGGSRHTVSGKRGQRLAIDAELWGALKVTVPVGSVPISVAVDGMQRGYAPFEVSQLQPGIHRLQFSGPGVAPWEQTVEVHVNRTVELVAQPIASPATGVLEVRATLADENGAEPLTGAQVWIDSRLSGVTPLRLELPRGPHSIRVRYRNEEAPVEVIDLPGGNLRYATLQLGLAVEAPRLLAALPDRIPLDRPTVLSASLDGAREGDVREMWLHVRTPDGAWRRYPMTLMKAPGGLVGVAVFPTVLFDSRGRGVWYVSASTPMGDEYFTELRPTQAGPAP